MYFVNEFPLVNFCKIYLTRLSFFLSLLSVNPLYGIGMFISCTKQTDNKSKTIFAAKQQNEMESTDQLEGDEEGVQQESLWRRKKLDFDR